jgi:hypothetical protein
MHAIGFHFDMLCAQGCSDFDSIEYLMPQFCSYLILVRLIHFVHERLSYCSGLYNSPKQTYKHSMCPVVQLTC